MRIRAVLRGTLANLLVAATTSFASGPSVPSSCRVEQANIIVDKAGRAEHLRIEFAVTADFVVSSAFISFYQSPAAGYKKSRMKRNARSLYVATLPVFNRLEYYISLKPETGANVQVGSQERPFILETSGLAKVKKSDHTTLKATVFFMMAVVAAVLSVGLNQAKPHNQK